MAAAGTLGGRGRRRPDDDVARAYGPFPPGAGYGLAFLAGAGMLVGAVRASDHGRGTDIAVFAGFALVGIWTLPTFALAFVAQAAVLLFFRRDLRRLILVACGAVAAASLLFYAPLLGEIATRSRQAGPRLPWYGWVSAPFSHLARPSLTALLPNGLAVRPLVLAIFVALAALACRRLLRCNDQVLLVNLVAPVVAAYLALVVARMAVFPRFGSFLLFHVLVLLALGAVELWTWRATMAPSEHWSPWPRRRAFGRLPPRRPIHARRAPRGLPASGEGRARHRNQPDCDQQQTSSGPVVLPRSPASGGGAVAERVDGVAVLHRRTPGLRRPPSPRHGGPRPDRTCLKRRGAARVHVNQRTRGSIDVWVISHSWPGRA